MVQCPCDSHKSYASCCQPFIQDKQIPQTPEELMRSRYTAYTQANTNYIKKTMRGMALVGFQETEASNWAKKIHWIGLQVIHSAMENTSKGYVEFEAIFLKGTRLQSMHENSEFLLDEGRWYYVNGKTLVPTYNGTLVSRNMDCPCGSKRKFKNCHGK